MSFIDLHVHSNASDGTLTPSEVVTAAKEAGLLAMALTDHDTVAGVKEAKIKADELGIELIPGVEISCHAFGKEIHILGFFLNEEDPDFLEYLANLREIRDSRNLKMLELFQKDGFPITMEKLEHGNPNTVITRAHFARVLIEEGIVPSKDAAFKKYLSDGKKYYVQRSEIKPKDAIAHIKQAGGVAVLAHPFEYHFSKQQLIDLIEELVSYGLSGIEVYHSNNYVEQSSFLRELTHRYHLAATGGSDFHGSNKPDIKIGVGRGGLRVHESLLEELKTFR